MPAREERRHRAHHAQRGLLFGLRLVHQRFCRLHGHDGAGLRRRRAHGRAPRGPGQPLHGLHELAREAGPEGRRHGGRHLRRPVLLGHEERPVQGHQDPRPQGDRRQGHRAGRHVLERRRAARVRAAHGQGSLPPRHLGLHGLLRRCAARARPCRRRRHLHAALQGRDRQPPGGAQVRPLRPVLQPLPAHHLRLRRRQALRHGQPLRARRRPQEGRLRRPQPVQAEERPALRP